MPVPALLAAFCTSAADERSLCKALLQAAQLRGGWQGRAVRLQAVAARLVKVPSTVQVVQAVCSHMRACTRARREGEREGRVEGKKLKRDYSR